VGHSRLMAEDSDILSPSWLQGRSRRFDPTALPTKRRNHIMHFGCRLPERALCCFYPILSWKHLRMPSKATNAPPGRSRPEATLGTSVACPFQRGVSPRRKITMTPVDSVIEDCEGFTTWTAQVRMMQVLLEACRPCAGFRT
jgi:hypothetical protein